ncbi:MAG: substrate-binding domain-containing protein [Flavobacteriaceae bacterium]
MKKTILFLLIALGVFFSCKKDKQEKETIVSGSVTVLTDESLFPVVEDQVNVFEHSYRANIEISSQSEAATINALLSDTTRIAILTRMLSPEEEAVFTNRNVKPRITRFAIDAIAFITHKKSNDTLVELSEVLQYIKGEPGKINALVFDNPNSGVMRLLCEKAGVRVGENPNLFSKSSSEELIRFISENEGYIGVVGVNWLTQPPQHLQQPLENITVMAVQNVKTTTEDTHYYKPSQVNIARKLYPLTREVYLLNYQGTTGLGMGFASFVAGDVGQRIILTSGLAPLQVEQMKINVTKEFNN